MTRKEAAEILGKSERQIKRLIEKKRLPPAMDAAEFEMAVYKMAEGGDIQEQFSTTRHDEKEKVLNTKHITSADELLQLLDVDESVWDVDQLTCNYYGNPSNANLQVKCRLKRVERFDQAFIEDIFSNLKSPEKFTASKIADTGHYMLKVNMHDLHFGKLCWQPESGENYDSKIARKRFMQAIHTFVEHAKSFSIKEVWFPIGNDFFNSDGIEMSTTAGTDQHDDGRWQKTYLEGCQLLIDGIDYIRERIAPVKLYNVGGNHDLQKSYYATLHLAAYYRMCPGVTIDISPAKHKAYKFGSVGIMDTHGDRIKRQELMNDFMVLFPDIWCKTKFREVHIGHLHHEVTTEVKGGKIRVMPSMSGTDSYHFNSGYVGTLAQCQAFLFHEMHGLSAIFNHNVV